MADTIFPEPMYAVGIPTTHPHERYEQVPHIGHRNHLCDMAMKGQVTLEQMKELVRDPKYICRKCGRVAANQENLCEAVSL